MAARSGRTIGLTLCTAGDIAQEHRRSHCIGDCLISSSNEKSLATRTSNAQRVKRPVRRQDPTGRQRSEADTHAREAGEWCAWGQSARVGEAERGDFRGIEEGPESL